MPKKTLSKTSQTTTKRATNPSVVKNVKAREGIKEEIIEKLNTLPDVDRAKIFQEMGVGGDVNSGKYYTCYLCGNLYPFLDHDSLFCLYCSLSFCHLSSLPWKHFHPQGFLFLAEHRCRKG